uniref:Uncharacterized protein n=1 Tax=Timema douglasi TaxID=61478 RepID=A0A7R8VBP0_TIMDO|nr:unnamed protein product [Timema douglasi]
MFKILYETTRAVRCSEELVLGAKDMFGESTTTTTSEGRSDRETENPPQLPPRRAGAIGRQVRKDQRVRESTTTTTSEGRSDRETGRISELENPPQLPPRRAGAIRRQVRKDQRVRESTTTTTSEGRSDKETGHVEFGV